MAFKYIDRKYLTDEYSLQWADDTTTLSDVNLNGKITRASREINLISKGQIERDIADGKLVLDVSPATPTTDAIKYATALLTEALLLNDGNFNQAGYSQSSGGESYSGSDDGKNWATALERAGAMLADVGYAGTFSIGSVGISRTETLDIDEFPGSSRCLTRDQLFDQMVNGIKLVNGTVAFTDPAVPSQGITITPNGGDAISAVYALRNLSNTQHPTTEAGKAIVPKADGNGIEYKSIAASVDLTPYAKTADLAPYAKTTDLAPYAKTTALSEYAHTTLDNAAFAPANAGKLVAVGAAGKGVQYVDASATGGNADLSAYDTRATADTKYQPLNTIPTNSNIKSGYLDTPAGGPYTYQAGDRTEFGIGFKSTTGNRHSVVMGRTGDIVKIYSPYPYENKIQYQDGDLAVNPNDLPTLAQVQGLIAAGGGGTTDLSAYDTRATADGKYQQKNTIPLNANLLDIENATGSIYTYQSGTRIDLGVAFKGTDNQRKSIVFGRDGNDIKIHAPSPSNNTIKYQNGANAVSPSDLPTLSQVQALIAASAGSGGTTDLSAYDTRATADTKYANLSLGNLNTTGNKKVWSTDSQGFLIVENDLTQFQVGTNSFSIGTDFGFSFEGFGEGTILQRQPRAVNLDKTAYSVLSTDGVVADYVAAQFDTEITLTAADGTTKTFSAKLKP